MIQAKERMRIQDLAFYEPISRTMPLINTWDYLDPRGFDAVKKLVDSRGDKIQWLDNLFQVKIAASEWYEQIEIRQTDVKSLKNRIDSLRSPESWLESQRLLTHALLALPEHREYFMQGIDYSEKLIKKIDSVKGKVGVTLFDAFDPYFYLSVICPDKAKNVTFDSESKVNLKHHLGMHYIFNQEPISLKLITQARIMFPNEPELYKIEDEDWVKIKLSLEKRSTGLPVYDDPKRLHKFLLDLASVKILTADEVKYSKERGLQIISHSNRVLMDANKIPERRRF